MKNVLKPLAKSFLIALGSTAPAAATDAAIHKEIFGPGMRKLIISNEKINNIMKIVKSLEESGLLIKCLLMFQAIAFDVVFFNCIIHIKPILQKLTLSKL